MEWPNFRPEPEPVPIKLNRERPSHRSRQDPNVRFMEDVGDRTRFIASQDIIYNTHAKSSGSRRGYSNHSPRRHRSHDRDDNYGWGRLSRRRRNSHDLDNDYVYGPSRRQRRSPHVRDNQAAHSHYHRYRRPSPDQDSNYDDYSDEFRQPHHSKPRNATDRFSDETDFDPVISGHERSLPSLTFHFNFAQVSPEEEHQGSTAPQSIRQSLRPDAKGYRYKMYHENIYNIVRSRYNGSIHGREDSTLELTTNNAQETSSRRQPELLKWMYASPIQNTSTAY